MRTIDEVYLTTSAAEATQVMAEVVQPKVALGDTGAPHAVKTTYPIVQRVPLLELELTYLYNPVVFNGINKIVQTIMSARHEVVAKDPKVMAFFNYYLDTLGNSGSDITWEELLSQIFKYQCIYGRAFVENIFNKKGNRIVDWDLIDPKKMDYAKSGNARIVLDKFNKPIGYIEVVPMEVPVFDNFLPPDIAPYITMWPNSIFLEPKRVAQIKLFTVGDGFYPCGLVEPIYKSSLRKLNVEEALANAIWRHGFPIFLAKIGDSNHEPTPQQVQSILEKLRDASFKQELSIPYYYDLSILESKKAEKLREHLEYFKDNEVTGMGIPKPYALGGGEATNRATLASQTQMFNLSVRDIINKTIYSIQKYMFKPVCDMEGFKEIPNIRWDIIGSDEIDNKAKRLFTYVKAGIIQPEELRPFIIGSEQLTLSDIPPPPKPQPKIQNMIIPDVGQVGTK